MESVAKFVGYAVIALVGIGLVAKLVGDGKLPTWNNDCKIHTAEAQPQPFLINGEWDAGYQVTAVVENKGSDSNLTIIAKLTSSEGDFTRRQTVPFREGESKKLSYQFHEPTISATNVSYIVSCQ